MRPIALSLWTPYPTGHWSFRRNFQKAVKRLESSVRNIAKGNIRKGLNDYLQANIYWARAAFSIDDINRKGQKAFGAETWGTIVSTSAVIAFSYFAPGSGTFVSSILSSSPFLAAMGGGAIVGYTSTTLGVLAAGGNFSDASKAGLKAGVIGGLSAGLTQGVSQLAGLAGSATSSKLIENGVKIAGHGIVQGGVSEFNGGSFKSGFMSGAFAGATEGLVGTYTGENWVAGTALSAMIGGTGSVIGGGKFMNGAKSGAMTYMFNWIFSSILEKLGASKEVVYAVGKFEDELDLIKWAPYKLVEHGKGVSDAVDLINGEGRAFL